MRHPHFPVFKVLLPREKSRQVALRRFLVVLSVLLLQAVPLPAQGFVWARAMGGGAADVALDTSGNVYTVGGFSAADFDPGPGIFNLTSAGSTDIHVSKLDSNGNFVWARGMGGLHEDSALGVAVDGSGNVYTVGSFRGTADFDPGPGIFNLTSAGLVDIFVSKLDSNGNFVWARAMGGRHDDHAWGVALDGSGNVLTVGQFDSSIFDPDAERPEGTADFDPGPGIFTLTSAGGADAFVSKLDSSGNFVWARGFGTPFAGRMFDNDGAFGVALDGSGNVYTTGFFFDRTADFDPGPGIFNLTSAGGFDAFVSKLDSGGNFVWARAMGGSRLDIAHGVALDGSGNVYTVGRFAGTVDFDPGPGTFNLTSAGLGAPSEDIYVSKLDSSGNFVWARRMGGGNADGAFGVAVDGSGNVYTVGRFGGAVDFDPGPGIFNLTSVGLFNAFVSKLDSSGNFAWAGAMGGGATDVAVDGSGNVYTVDGFSGTADFDPGPGIFNLTPAGFGGIFVSKLSAEIPSVVNHLVPLSQPLQTEFSVEAVSGGPAGTFTIRAWFTNTSSAPILEPAFEVIELSGGNLLLNADGGPSGVGGRLAADVGDGVLSPGESFEAEFTIGLQEQSPFSFFLNLIGTPQ